VLLWLATLVLALIAAGLTLAGGRVGKTVPIATAGLQGAEP
jgi:hypothetical protein